jgi:hypothetical protein
VDVMGRAATSTATRREPSMPPCLPEAKATGLASVSVSQSLIAPCSLAQQGCEQADAPNGKRTTQRSHLAQQHARQPYPSSCERVLSELRRISLARRSAAVGAVAAVVVAGVLVPLSALMPTRVAQERATSHSTVAAVIDERAPMPAPAHLEPHVRVIVAGAPPREPSNSMFSNATPPTAYEDTLPQPFARRAPRAARSNLRSPTPPRPLQPCDCFPGDPLCGCLD